MARKVVIDLDDTLTTGTAVDYSDKEPRTDIVERLHEYRSNGFEIVILTARNMRTYEGNVGKINKHTLPVIIDWLHRHAIPYDEIWVGKPWCGHEGFYVDDKAVRPDEFANLSYAEIQKLIGGKVVDGN